MKLGIIPALDEKDRIGAVINRTRPFLDKLVVCDDGSIDGTGEVAKRLGVEVIRHPKRLGYGAALHTLFLRAMQLKADATVTIDADGQHDPESIPLLTRPVLEGKADLVVGSRFIVHKSTIPTKRLFGILLVTKLTQLMTRRKMTDSQCGLRCYSSRALKSVLPHARGMGASLEILLLAHRNGLRVIEAPTDVSYNGESDSSHDSISHMMNLLFTLFRSGLIQSTRVNPELDSIDRFAPS